MNITSLFLFILACFALTKIVVSGRILDPIRPKWYYFHCSLCFGFAAGIITAWVFHFAEVWVMPLRIVPALCASFVFALVGSGTSFMLSSIVSDYGVKMFHQSPMPPQPPAQKKI